MMKLDGVADAMVLRELPKSAMDDIVRQMKSSMLARLENDRFGWRGDIRTRNLHASNILIFAPLETHGSATF
jgi:hypothetical protein